MDPGSGAGMTPSVGLGLLAATTAWVGPIARLLGGDRVFAITWLYVLAASANVSSLFNSPWAPHIALAFVRSLAGHV